MDADDSEQKATTRSNLQGARELVKVGDQIGKLQKQLSDLQNSQSSLASSLNADLVPRHATIEDKIAAHKFLKSNAEATQSSVCRLLADGGFPGLENQFVLLKQANFSKFISAGEKACGSAGRPPVLSDADCRYISIVVENCSFKNKAALSIQVKMLMRTLALMRHGLADVKVLDSRNNISNLDADGKKRRRKTAPQRRLREAANSDEEDADSDTTEDGETVDFKQSLATVFGNTAHSLNLQRVAGFQWPSDFTFRNYSAKYGWTDRKLHQTPLHRFEGANPDIILLMFEHLDNTKIMFNITTMEQVHNGDECRTCMEFQRTGELLRACVLTGSDAKRPSHGNAIPKGMKGITLFGSISNTADCVTVIREGKANKQIEADLLKDCAALTLAGIPVDVISTESGYQNHESFVLCILFFMQHLHNKEFAAGVHGAAAFEFADRHNPKMSEIPRLPRFHIYELDNAGTHDTQGLAFRLEAFNKGLIIFPLPKNSTEVTQALDQDCHKVYKLWLRENLLKAMEMELSGGFTNDLHLAVWTSLIKSNKAHAMMPKHFDIDFQRDFVGDAEKLRMLEKTNAALVAGSRSSTPWNTSRLLRIVCPAFAAALAHEYCESSWIQVGQMRSKANEAPACVETRHQVQERNEIADAHATSHHHIFPQAVLKNPICVAAKEIAERKLKNAQVEKEVLVQAAARFAGLVPALAGQYTFDSRVISSNIDANGERVLKYIFGDQVPDGAALFLNAIRRAEAVVDMEEKEQKKRDEYVRSLPEQGDSLQARVAHQDQTAIGLNVVKLREKLPLLQAQFDAAKMLATATTSKIEDIQRQCDAVLAEGMVVTKASTKEAITVFGKLQTLLAPKGNRKSLTRLYDDCNELLNKAIGTRTELHTKYSEAMVPLAILNESFGDEVSKDWGATAAVHTLQPLLRPIALLPTKLAQKYVIPNVDAALAAAAAAALAAATSAADIAAQAALMAAAAVVQQPQPQQQQRAE